mmetsp:Transcript_32856/g.76750  ORF Transcript_32856/g.76750 Transcript_32856/m.76750 type:complete len:119 (+) Transcript_32856:37-393(+)|eukprot:s628_g8.t1
MRSLRLLGLCGLLSAHALQGSDDDAASAKSLFLRLDTNSDGAVDQEELVMWMMTQDPEMAHEDALEEASSAFEAFDEDKNEKFSQDEFTQAVSTMESLNDHDRNEEEEDDELEKAQEH